MSQTLEKPILVQKYGGSSVANSECVKNVARRVAAKSRAGKAVVVVVSAMGKTTDSLVNLSQDITLYPQDRELDMLLHAGKASCAAFTARSMSESSLSGTKE